MEIKHWVGGKAPKKKKPKAKVTKIVKEESNGAATLTYFAPKVSWCLT